ncbi:MAG: chemotaxis protein CheX [Magnetococcus sp. WYHC-3]
MKEKLGRAVGEAIVEIAETMLFLEVTPGDAIEGVCDLQADYSAVVGYSNALRGSLRLAGPSDTVCRLAGALLGEPRESMDLEMNDAFAEVANMIAGGVQSRVEEELGPIRLSPPVIISGQNHHVATDHTLVCLSQTFELEGGAFFTELYFSMKELGRVEVQESGNWQGLAVVLPHVTGFELPGAEAAAPSQEQVEQTLARLLQEGALADLARGVTREVVTQALPGVAGGLIEAEMQRLRGELAGETAETPAAAGTSPWALSDAELDALVRQAFAAPLERAARDLARQAVRQSLPRVAEAVIQEELARLQDP